MVISRKFIFIHIPKNAGSAMTQFLQREPGASRGGFSYPHYTMDDYTNHFGQKNIDGLFSFALIRNPWSRLYSWYKFNQRRHREMPQRYRDQPSFQDKQFENDFNEWLLHCSFIPNEERKYNPNPIPAQKRSQFDWLNCNIDFIGKVEELDKAIFHLYNTNIISTNRLPGKVNFNPQKEDYRKVYSKESIEFVEKHFSKDIEYGEYSFSE